MAADWYVGVAATVYSLYYTTYCTLTALRPDFEIDFWYIIARRLAVWQWRQIEEHVARYLAYGVWVVTDDSRQWRLTQLDQLTRCKDTRVLVPKPATWCTYATFLLVLFTQVRQVNDLVAVTISNI